MAAHASILIDSIDHIVLTVRDLAASREFYTRVLGMRLVEEPGRPLALHFGNQKIHLHQAGKEFEPKSERPTPGSGDLCLIALTPVAEVAARLKAEGVTIELGPVQRTGAVGPILSIYFRDPDRNLIEVSNYL